MRGTVKIAVSLLLALSLCACGSGGANQPATDASDTGDAQEVASDTEEKAEDTEEAADKTEEAPETAEPQEEEYDPYVENIDLSLEGGNMRFDHFEEANPELVDSDHALVFVFDFTNEQAKPAQAQSVFRIQFFQNGTELNDNPTYSSKGGDQYDLVKAFFNEAMKGGTVTFGKIVEPKDDSPITIMVSPNGAAVEDNYQMMEVVIDGSQGTDDNAASFTSDDVDAALQGVWDMGDDNKCTFDQGTVTLSSADVTLSGLYEFNMEKSAIIGHLQATDDTVDFVLLFDYDGETVRVFKDIDKQDELIKL